MRKGQGARSAGPCYLPKPAALSPADIEAAQLLFDGSLNGNALTGAVDHGL